jgi:SAM-dependent methyltransferase
MVGMVNKTIRRGLRKLGDRLGRRVVVAGQHRSVAKMRDLLTRAGERDPQGISASLPRLVAEIRDLREICTRIQYQTAIAPDGLPIPPPELHAIVSGTDGLDAAQFLEVGRGCAEGITKLLGKCQVRLNEQHAILDFGCGCGRIIRHFHTLEGPRLYGTDYDRRLVEWCQRNLPFAEFGVNNLQPPLTYADDTFDLVYAFSVFTHLSEPLQKSWLSELARVLRPGGYLLMTTQGEPYADQYLAPHEREQFHHGRMVVQQNGRQPGEGSYNAYHPISYVRETLAKGFEVAEFVPGVVIDANRRLIAQDSHLLRNAG